MGPLDGLRIWEITSTPAVAFAGHLLGDLGGAVEVLELTDGSALGLLPPVVGARSMLFDYLAYGKTTRMLPEQSALPEDAASINVVIHDGQLADSWKAELDRLPVPPRGRAVVSVTPYGATGPKRDWKGSELTLYQAGGEGFLMPSGLGFELFPDRPPIGVGRYVAYYAGGLTAALTLLAGLRVSRQSNVTEWIDISIQEAQLSLNYFTVARFVDGVLENRANRAFMYGGVLACTDGFVELLTLEQKQWEGLVELMGNPDWTQHERLKDPIRRAEHGDEINLHLREWAAERPVVEVVAGAAAHGVPCGPFVAAEDLASIPQVRARSYFDETVDGLRPGTPWVIERANSIRGG